MPINAKTKTKTKSGMGFLIFFWSFWTLLIGSFDLMIAYKAIQQIRTFSFKPVVAILDKSEVESESDGEGTSYKAVVEYHYTVDEKEFKSNRLEFLDTSFGPADAESRLPATFVGGELTAFYDPNSPSVSVLRRGFRLNDLIVPIFLLPFNAVSLCGFVYLLDWLRSRSRGYSSLQFRIKEADNRTELRFYKFSPLFALIMAAGASGFVMIFFIVFMPHGWMSVDLRMLIAIILIAGFSVWAYVKSSRYYSEIAIDQFRNELSFGKFGGKELDAGLIRNVPLNQSLSLAIKETSSTDSEGDTSFSYLLTLNSTSEKLIELHEYHVREDAEQMARWLGEFGLRFAETEE